MTTVNVIFCTMRYLLLLIASVIISLSSAGQCGSIQSGKKLIEPYEDYQECYIGFRERDSKKTVISPQYSAQQYIQLGSCGYYIIEKDEKFGLINTVGDFVLPFQNDIRLIRQNLVIVHDGITTLLSNSLDTIFSKPYSHFNASEYNGNLVWIGQHDSTFDVYSNQLKRLFTTKGNKLNLARQIHYKTFRGKFHPKTLGYYHKMPLHFELKKNGLTGVLDSAGNTILPSEYSYLRLNPFVSQEGKLHLFWLAKKGKHWGVVDDQNNFLAVTKGRGYGIELEMYPLYCGNEIENNRIVGVFTQLGEKKLFDFTAKKVYPRKYRKLNPGCGIVHFQRGKKSGIINSFGQEVHAAQSRFFTKSQANYFSDFNRFNNQHRESMDKDIYYQQLNSFVDTSGYSGLINKFGDVIIDGKYTFFKSWKEQDQVYIWAFRLVESETAYGDYNIDVYTVSGELVNEFIDVRQMSYHLKRFLNGTANTIVLKRKDEQYAMVGPNGKSITGQLYDDYGGRYFQSDDKAQFHSLKSNDKWGVIDHLGQIQVPFDYDGIQSNKIIKAHLFKRAGKQELHFYETGNMVEADSFEFVYEVYTSEYSIKGSSDHQIKKFSGKGHYMLGFRDGHIFYVANNGSLMPYIPEKLNLKGDYHKVNKYVLNNSGKIIFVGYQDMRIKGNTFFDLNKNCLTVFDRYKGIIFETDQIDQYNFTEHRNEFIYKTKDQKVGVYSFALKKEIIAPKYYGVAPYFYEKDNYDPKRLWVKMEPDTGATFKTGNWNLLLNDTLALRENIDNPARMRSYRDKSAFAFEQHGRFGLMDQHLNIILEPKYRFIGEYKNQGKFQLLKPDEGWQLNDFKFGTIPSVFNDISLHHDTRFYFTYSEEGDEELLSIYDAQDSLKVILGPLSKDAFFSTDWAMIDSKYEDKYNPNWVHPFAEHLLYPVKEIEKSNIKNWINNRYLWYVFNAKKASYQNFGFSYRREQSRLFNERALNKPMNKLARIESKRSPESIKVLFAGETLYSEIHSPSRKYSAHFDIKDFSKYDTYQILDDSISKINYYDLFTSRETVETLTFDFLSKRITDEQLFGFSCTDLNGVIQEMIDNFSIKNGKVYFNSRRYTQKRDMILDSPEILSYLKEEFKIDLSREVQ